MNNTTDSAALRKVAEGLAAAAGRMEAKEASRVCGPAAAVLIQATSNPLLISSERQTLSGGLDAVALRLEGQEAKEAARVESLQCL